MKYKFDISKVKLTDLDGNNLNKEVERQLQKPLAKDLGNLLYTNIADLDFLEKAKQVHAGQAIELDQNQKQLFEQLIKNCHYNGFIKLGLLAELKEVKS